MYSRGKYAYQEQDDYSFSSQSDDYESSSNEYQKFETSSDENEKNASTQEIDIEKVIDQSSSTMSKSLLHVLDGNDLSQISPQTSFDRTKKRHLNETIKDDSSSPESYKKPLLESDENDSTDF